MKSARFLIVTALGVPAVLAGFGLYSTYRARPNPPDSVHVSPADPDPATDNWLSESKPAPGHINHINDTVNTVKVFPVKPETPIQRREN